MVTFLAELNEQENFDFLLQEFKTTNDVLLQQELYAALVKLARQPSIFVPLQDRIHLSQHQHLLPENAKANPVIPPQLGVPPSAFRKSLMENHLQRLESMSRNGIWSA